MSSYIPFPSRQILSDPSRVSQTGSCTPLAGSAPVPLHLFRREDEQSWEDLSAKPPTALQLANLSALSTGMASAMSAKSMRRRKPRGSKQSLAREGAVYSKNYDCLGSRPQPNNGLSLEQSIQVELIGFAPAWLTSSTTTGVQSGAAQAFTFGLFSGSASLASTFDQYRIDQLETWITATTPNSLASFPILTTAVDLDDANVPASSNAVEDHIGAVTSDGPGGHYHKWKPHVAVAAYSGAFTSYANLPSQFIDSASPNVSHFGLKAVCYSTGAVAINYDLIFRAVITVRAPVIN
jgi:hypothetical protein